MTACFKSKYKTLKNEMYKLFMCSDSHSVLNLLIQELLNQFNIVFLNETLSTSEQENLKEFLYRDEILLLLSTIYHISMQV